MSHTNGFLGAANGETETGTIVFSFLWEEEEEEDAPLSSNLRFDPCDDDDDDGAECRGGRG